MPIVQNFNPTLLFVNSCPVTFHLLPWSGSCGYCHALQRLLFFRLEQLLCRFPVYHAAWCAHDLIFNFSENAVFLFLSERNLKHLWCLFYLLSPTLSLAPQVHLNMLYQLAHLAILLTCSPLLALKMAAVHRAVKLSARCGTWLWSLHCFCSVVLVAELFWPGLVCVPLQESLMHIHFCSQ